MVIRAPQPPPKRQLRDASWEPVKPRQRRRSADGKIPVPRVRGTGELGAPLGAAHNFGPKKKKKGADAPGALREEEGPNGERFVVEPLGPDAERVASLLARNLRGLMGRSQEKCRLWVVAPTVTLVEYVSGKGSRRLAFEGVSTCKSCNCPLCARKWERTRTGEIQAAVANWLRKQLPVIFATFTMRHHKGMPLALQHRLLTKAFGELWSGTKGQKFKARLGGKPEFARAHDLTWSLEEWWHPHLHSLMFFPCELEGLDEGTLLELLDERWREALPAALRSMNKLIRRMLGDEKKRLAAGPCRVHARFLKRIARRGKRCWRGHALHRRLGDRKQGEPEQWAPIADHHQCSDCAFELGLRSVAFKEKRGKKKGYTVVGTIPQPGDRVLHEEVLQDTCPACMFGLAECPNHRERAARMFGTSLVPGHVPLKDSLIRIRKMLRTMTAKNILPTRERGVKVDRIRQGDHADQVSGYLPKLGAIGFELAASSTKMGWEDSRGHRHFTKWEVAKLCAMRQERGLREAARRAWRQMYKATKGTATITFSDRVALGLGPDPYEDDNEPPEIDIDEEEVSRVLGEVDKPVWVGMAREHRHTLIGALVSAHRAGALERLDWVMPPIGKSGEPRPVHDPEDRAPPELSRGVSPELAAEARARWRAERARATYEAEKVDRSRRWERLRAVADVDGPEAWRTLLEALQGEDQWKGAGALRGAEHWHLANAAHEREEARRVAAGDRYDMVTKALDSLGDAGALAREGPSFATLKLRVELVKTLRRTGFDRVTADRLAREMTS